MLVYVASIVMGYGVDGTGLETRKGQELFVFSKVHNCSRAQRAFYSMDTGVLSSRVRAARA